jgi:two-component system response regulator FixJ
VVHIVDDDDAVRDALGALFRGRGFTVRGYGSAQALLDSEPDREPGCVLTDLQMPQMSGLELLGRLREAGMALPVIVMTGRAERRMAEEAVRQGAAAFVHKPFGPDDIVAAVRLAIERAAL